ncbi:hypothetical protein [Nocardioides conyzicola]|uniref:hypothetical protein n=1 Tax=Nocardioides conyzicola TaxID=1651781 RepID=UPI0031EB9DC8
MTEHLADRGIPSNLQSYVCLEVFRGERPVLLVSREDGDWCFICGEGHPDDPAFYRVAGIGHPVGDDLTLAEVLDLDADEEAERAFVGGP